MTADLRLNRAKFLFFTVARVLVLRYSNELAILLQMSKKRQFKPDLRFQLARDDTTNNTYNNKRNIK